MQQSPKEASADANEATAPVGETGRTAMAFSAQTALHFVKVEAHELRLLCMCNYGRPLTPAMVLSASS